MTARAALPFALLVLLAILGLAITQASAQRGHMLLGPTERALHTQLLESDLVAVGSVADVSPGRIRVASVVAVKGAVGETIEVKRAPSRPPGLQPGERILLLLRGARSPYLLVSSAEELLRLTDATAEKRSIEAVLDLHAALEDPPALRERYREWLAGTDDGLRRLAEVALTNPAPPLEPLEPDFVLGLTALAIDPMQPTPLRRAASRIAASDAEGVAALLAALPLESAEATDPLLLLDVLRLGALRQSPEVQDALLRSMRHDDASIRLTALELGPTLTRDPELRAEIERMAQEDPSESVRKVAEPLLRARRSARERQTGE